MSRRTVSSNPDLPGGDIDTARVAGHWLLARLGKRVLRPGGVEITEQLLAAVEVRDTDDVVEIAPGLGATTRRLLDPNPKSYTGVDRDPDAAGLVASLLDGPNRRIVHATASETGLDADLADVVFGEAYLTMQPDSLKRRVIAELARIARPGARLALHEVAFAPREIAPEARESVVAALSSTIKVSVTPMTIDEWRELLESQGFSVRHQFTAPLHLLEPRRLLRDEGLVGAARFVLNVARDRSARDRVVAMREAMRDNAEHLQAVGLVAVRGLAAV